MSTHLCLKLLFCLYIKAPGLLLAGTDVEGEDDEGEEMSSEARVDEEWVEGVLDEGLAFVLATVAVGGVSAWKKQHFIF